MTVEIDARVIRPMQETSEDQHYATGKQQAARRAAVSEQSILYMRWRIGSKMIHQTQEIPKSGKDHQQSTKVRKKCWPSQSFAAGYTPIPHSESEKRLLAAASLRRETA